MGKINFIEEENGTVTVMDGHKEVGTIRMQDDSAEFEAWEEWLFYTDDMKAIADKMASMERRYP